MTKKEATARVFLTGCARAGYSVIVDIREGYAAERIAVADCKTGHAIVRGIRAALTGKV